MNVTAVYVVPGRKPQNRRAGSDPVFAITVSTPPTVNTLKFKTRPEAEEARARILDGAPV